MDVLHSFRRVGMFPLCPVRQFVVKLLDRVRFQALQPDRSQGRFHVEPDIVLVDLDRSGLDII